MNYLGPILVYADARHDFDRQNWDRDRDPDRHFKKDRDPDLDRGLTVADL